MTDSLQEKPLQSYDKLVKNMDDKKAYRAMYYFLENQWNLSLGEEKEFFGGLLGSMSLLEDGSTADPAMWSDWMEAIKRSETDLEGVKLKFIK